MAAKGGKTLSWDKENAKFKRLPTADYAFGAEGVLVASYRIASLSAEGMAYLPELDDGERGAITLTASVAAQDGQIGQVVYGSCKAGVNGLVLPMARDLMDLGIRVNCIVPGRTDTEMRSSNFGNERQDTLFNPYQVAITASRLICDDANGVLARAD
jgi:NAD(P)-dependent dehydrogenase (short-subunit alcohol dehydrogenase family)